MATQATAAGGEEAVEDASTLRHRHSAAKSGGGEEGRANGAGAAQQGEDEPAALSVERAFADRAVPSWREQLTVRAFVVGSLLAVVFNVILMKINLATGINPSLNVCASLLSYLLPRPRLDQAHRELRLAQAALHSPGEHHDPEFQPDLRRISLRHHLHR